MTMAEEKEEDIGITTSSAKLAIDSSDITQEGRSSNQLESIFNVVNSIIGGGIIGLAYSYRMAGLPTGLLLLIFCGLITDFAMILLVRCSEIAKRTSYQTIVEAAFGRPGLIVITIAQFCFPLTVMMAYNVAVADNIPKVFSRVFDSDHLLANRYFINAITTVFVMLPLSMPKNIALLDKASALSIFCVLFYSIVIVIRAGTLAPVMVPSADAWEFSKSGILQAIGVIAFAYACLHSVLPMYRAMKGNSIKRFSAVSHCSIVLTTAFYLLVSLAGYLTFTSQSQGNLLNNFCPDDDLANAARLVFALTIILTYPIQCFTAREVIEVGFFKTRPASKLRHCAITLGLVGISFGVSMATDCLGLVIEIAGCVTASPLVFIFPPLCYMKLSNRFGKPTLKTLPYWLLVTFGVVVMILGATMAIINQAGNCSFSKTERYWCGGPNTDVRLLNATSIAPPAANYTL